MNQPKQLPRLRRRWPPWCIEIFEERAAILEFDANLKRDESERRAQAEVERVFERLQLKKHEARILNNPGIL